jgi:tetratricopeptide (TPR) repeat protein
MDENQLMALFNQARRYADAGDLATSVKAYLECLRIAQGQNPPISREGLPQFVRSAAINLTQVLNQQGRFAEALEKVTLASFASPSPAGWARALAAKGEALCGLGRIEEGRAAFEQAVRYQAVVGALNSADSITRLASEDLLPWAETLVRSVLDEHAAELNHTYRAEALTILGKIELRRKRPNSARGWFDKAIREDPQWQDARQHLQSLDKADAGKRHTAQAAAQPTVQELAIQGLFKSMDRQLQILSEPGWKLWILPGRRRGAVNLLTSAFGAAFNNKQAHELARHIVQGLLRAMSGTGGPYALGALLAMGPSAVPYLIESLASIDPILRLAACVAVGKLGRLARAASGTLGQLMAMDPDPNIRAQAAISVALVDTETVT